MVYAKSTPSYFLGLTFLGIISHCQTYNDNVCPKLKNYEVCNIGGIQYVLKINSTGIDGIVDLFSKLEFFWTYFWKY